MCVLLFCLVDDGEAAVERRTRARARHQQQKYMAGECITSQCNRSETDTSGEGRKQFGDLGAGLKQKVLVPLCHTGNKESKHKSKTEGLSAKKCSHSTNAGGAWQILGEGTVIKRVAVQLTRSRNVHKLNQRTHRQRRCRIGANFTDRWLWL